MCIILANLSYEQTGISPTEKHILLILCNHADPDTKTFYVSIARLIKESGYCKNTVDKTMKSLRDKKLIRNTGNKTGKKRVIPIYEVTISNDPTTWDSKHLMTPSGDDITPTGGVGNNPTSWDIERHKKERRKENNHLSISEKATQEQKQMLAYFINHPEFPMPSELQKLISSEPVLQ